MFLDSPPNYCLRTQKVSSLPCRAHSVIFHKISHLTPNFNKNHDLCTFVTKFSWRNKWTFSANLAGQKSGLGQFFRCDYETRYFTGDKGRVCEGLPEVDRGRCTLHHHHLFHHQSHHQHCHNYQQCLKQSLFRQESFTTLLVNKVETQISFSWWDENILQMILRDADYQMNENVNFLKFWDAFVFIEHQPFTNIHQTDDDESRWSADKHITRMKIFRWELFDNYLEQFLVFYWFVKTFCAELQFFLS